MATDNWNNPEPNRRLTGTEHLATYNLGSDVFLSIPAQISVKPMAMASKVGFSDSTLAHTDLNPSSTHHGSSILTMTLNGLESPAIRKKPRTADTRFKVSITSGYILEKNLDDDDDPDVAESPVASRR